MEAFLGCFTFLDWERAWGRTVALARYCSVLRPEWEKGFVMIELTRREKFYLCYPCLEFLEIDWSTLVSLFKFLEVPTGVDISKDLPPK